MDGTILVTGVTGFLGKVVLEELLRCRDTHSFERIAVVIRPREKVTAGERFLQEVASSLCFSRLPQDWASAIDTISADLSSERCGIEASIYEQLRLQTTRIIHCAGSVAFSPSAAYETISDNITSTLNVLELARSCPGLQQLVHTSTAYGTPHSNIAIEETIPSSESIEDLHALLEEGKTPITEILERTGHPNLYTLAKWLAEHLLVKNRKTVPLTIVRPSIISASLKYPFPGWIDSFAALAGLVAGVGTGCLRVLNASPETVLDVVPVDVVAKRLITEAFLASSHSQETRIVHVVSGIKHGMKISTACPVVLDYFTRHPVLRTPRMWHIGNKTALQYQLHDVAHQRLPRTLAKVIAKVQRDKSQLQRVQKVRSLEMTANTAFEHFTHHTYDFRAATPSFNQNFDAYSYLRVVCQGVRVYLLQRDPTEAVFAGSQARGTTRSLRWLRKQPGGNLVTAVAAKTVKKTFRRVFGKVTFDEHSFLETIGTIPDEKAHIVIVPTHRSYLDSIVCSYLFFTRPELHIQLPRVLASEEFSKIPVVGWVCRQFRTVFVVRGGGKPDQRLDFQLKELVDERDNLMFFVEGQRSRTGETLPGKRGVLRSLQSTGADFAILPVRITYDRIPEASVFADELKGGSRQLASFKGLAGWILNVMCGQVALGDVHVECGPLLLLEPSTDVHEFVEELTKTLSSNETRQE